MSDAANLPPVAQEPVAQRLPPVMPPEQSERSKRRLRMHPYSGGLLMLVDNVCFGANAALAGITAGLSVPVLSFIAFSITSLGVFLTQRYLDEDSFGKSLAKAFFAGVLAGVPTSIAGTAVGGSVLLISGISAMNKKEP